MESKRYVVQSHPPSVLLLTSWALRHSSAKVHSDYSYSSFTISSPSLLIEPQYIKDALFGVLLPRNEIK